jgi:hypothetical protein
LKYPITNKYGETLEPTGHIRERGAAAIFAAKPSGYEVARHYEVRLSDPMGFFLCTFDQGHRKFAEEWFDNLLVALDKMGLQVTEINEDMERW